ncbi:hypothetical protein WELLINGTON_124 [Erwinia phage Wellington]|uniref:Uncharacterized protein n=2 Tax=Wellingtonvirus wellington TaxID=2734153 RepID=A0A1B2IE47_9CAUD|nr:hypothetical protein BIZ80_gp176 [Erwinia phage vB_EamM_Kwan]YP_009806608.1 hypothetical protein HOT70_gp177 [Erwinia phage Wellington]ANZ49475.1 hypothetical protein KWAN_123 [Erwinia phage vB_EamM_Kwan]AXF51254.1 hypothetical protein WELLINGTON_124 [Erwinia phage Wellington]
MSAETKRIKMEGIRVALQRSRTKLDEEMAKLPATGIIPFDTVPHFNEINRLLVRIRNLNIALAYLAGIPNGVQALAYKVTAPRISQVVKAVLKM